MEERQTLKNIEKLLSAITTLLIEYREENSTKKPKIEVLLRKLGLDVSEIAKLTDKNPGAVRKMIQRSK